MSNIIASDAPLLSPIQDHAAWDASYSPATDAFAHYYIPASPSSSTSNSPIPTERMLKMRMSPESAPDGEQLCLPTHRIFDFPEQFAPASPVPKQERLSISINPAAVAASVAAKRSASPAMNITKRPRAAGERINSKDFIPPDVSGLSKREARLVKNRAAAFLSRQRKREEFECMEVRVAELEQENARLLALTQNSASIRATSCDGDLVSEIENLKEQLAAAKERERELCAQLVSKSTPASSNPPAIKIEEVADPELPPSRTSATSVHKSGASLGLMVLLCALPTLLSLPMHSALPTSFALPNAPIPAASKSFDFNSFIPNDYDWARTSGNTLMDLDDDLNIPSSLPTSTARKLEFSTPGDSSLDGLDISFDTTPADHGKIRVRIHPSSSTSSRATSPGLTDTKPDISSSSSHMWGGPESESTLEASFSPSSFGSSTSSSLSALPSSYPPSPTGDPFLGVGASTGDFSVPYASDVSDMFGVMDDGQLQDVCYGSEYSLGSDGSAKRRVRIALKSLPAAGGEGGEWEVQIC